MTLKPKHQKFAHFYADTGNASKSAILSGYDEKVSRHRGHQLAHRKDIQKEVKRLTNEAIRKAKTNPEYLVNKLRTIVEVTHDASKIGYNPTASIKAIEMLGKLQGMWLDDKGKLTPDKLNEWLSNLFDGIIPIFESLAGGDSEKLENAQNELKKLIVEISDIE